MSSSVGSGLKLKGLAASVASPPVSPRFPPPTLDMSPAAKQAPLHRGNAFSLGPASRGPDQSRALATASRGRAAGKAHHFYGVCFSPPLMRPGPIGASFKPALLGLCPRNFTDVSNHLKGVRNPSVTFRGGEKGQGAGSAPAPRFTYRRLRNDDAGKGGALRGKRRKCRV